MIAIPLNEQGEAVYTGENTNILSEKEWRTIHNALSAYQSTFGSVFLTDYTIEKKQELQQLMDKIRDHYIAPSASEGCERTT